MKIPKYFQDWFNDRGLLDDHWQSLEAWQRDRILRIAWRAYRKGKKDGHLVLNTTIEGMK